MTTSRTNRFRFDDKRTWFATLKRDHLERIESKIPKEYKSKILDFMYDWVYGKNKGETKK